MVWVGSFKSLQTALRTRFIRTPFQVHTWIRTEITVISPVVDWFMTLIVASRCVAGKEDLVALALQEALNNAMLHGNSLDPRRLVHIRCCCDHNKGVLFIVRDQGHGFDPNQLPDPLALENRLCAGIRRDAMKERVSVVVVVRLDSAECATTNSRKS